MRGLWTRWTAGVKNCSGMNGFLEVATRLPLASRRTLTEHVRQGADDATHDEKRHCQQENTNRRNHGSMCFHASGTRKMDSTARTAAVASSLKRAISSTTDV